jgi:signal transduction histidine kinase
MAAALLWSLASAASSGRPPLQALPYGVLVMSVAGTMGLGVWRLAQRVPWNWRAPSFYLSHGLALIVFSAIYSTAWSWPDFLAGRQAEAMAALSLVLGWNLLMGSWLYLVIAGCSYAILANERARAHEAAAAEARLLAQQAQLTALRAQINPHFLFNALHSVGALVATDPARADRALERLGDLLRYALRTDSDVVFDDEWKFTQDYLAFEQMGFGDRLRVDAHADPEARAVPVPPLILQPLVENAVRHGIADRAQGGCVSLHASVDSGRLRFRVADDGPGFDGTAAHGVGLASVRGRLAALYGDRASLDIDSSRDGCIVTVELPARAVNDLGFVA